MALLISQTDSDTGAVYPAAYLRIDGINLTTLGVGGAVTLGIYATQDAAVNGFRPLRKIEFKLSRAEAAVLRTQGLALLYGIIAANPDFAGAVSV